MSVWNIEHIELPSPLTADDLQCIVYGACFLASGGGGPMQMALNMLELMTEKDTGKLFTDVKCIPADQLGDDEIAVVVCDMGSPDQALRHGLGYEAPINAFKALSQYLKNQGSRVTCLMPIELGAVNTLLPFYIASKIKKDTGEEIAVINGDPSGRAVPTIGLTLLHTKGDPISICPAAVASDTKTSKASDTAKKEEPHVPHQIYIDPNIDPHSLEYATGILVKQWHKVGGLACYPTKGKLLNHSNPKNKDKLIHGSIGLCWKIGKQIFMHAKKPTGKLQALLKDFGIESYVLDKDAVVYPSARGGSDSILDVGKYIAKGPSGVENWIFYENENLMALTPKRLDVEKEGMLAMGPDIITFLASNPYTLAPENRAIPAGTPFSNADIIPCLQYDILGIASDWRVRNQPMIINFQQTINQILHEIEPQSEKIISYTPIEKLHLGERSIEYA